MEIQERDRILRQMKRDPRLAALLDFIAQQEDEFVESACSQAMAADPGKQSHAAGSVYAMRTLSEALLTLVNSPEPGAVKKPSGR